MSMRRRVASGLSAVLLVAAVLYGYGRYQRSRPKVLAPLVTELPKFSEPDGGARATFGGLYGFEIGRTSLSQARARLSEPGIVCEDSSIRVMVQKLRDAKARELEAAKAKGEVDAVTGASILWRRSPKESNPQIRLSCADTSTDKLGVAGAPVFGELLLIFDSESLPLRHVSFGRSHRQGEAATRDFDAALARLQAAYGEATVKPKDPAAQPDGGAFPWVTNYEYAWNFADLSVKVSALNLGETRGISLREFVEIRWPVRSDVRGGAVESGTAQAQSGGR